MKLDKKAFIFARARNIGHTLAEEEFKRLQERAKSKKSDVKIYLDEYGNEVHVKGPIVDRVRKVETLQERIARYDRLAASVRASRASMSYLMGEMFTDEDDEDPYDDSSMSDVVMKDDFGDDIPVKSPAKQEMTPADDGSADLSGDEPVSQPSSKEEPAIKADGETVEN